MDARFDGPDSAAPTATEQRDEGNRRLKLGVGIALVVLLLAVTTHSREHQSNAAPPSAAAPTPAAAASGTEAPPAFDYFPAQFGPPVPDGMPEEHIQAF